MARISAYDDWLYRSAENEMQEEEVEMTEEQLKAEEIDGCFEILGNHSDIHVQTESLKIYKYVQELKKNNKELNDFRNSEVAKLLVKNQKMRCCWNCSHNCTNPAKEPMRFKYTTIDGVGSCELKCCDDYDNWEIRND